MELSLLRQLRHTNFHLFNNIFGMPATLSSERLAGADKYSLYFNRLAQALASIR